MRTMQWILVFFLFLPLVSHAELSYDHYSKWLKKDQLYFSTANEGEKWKWHYRLDKIKEPQKPLSERMAICYKYEGAWNHYINDCSFPNETHILEYIRELEGATEFHASPPKNQEILPKDMNSKKLKWNEYRTWSPSIQLYFSTFNTGETSGEFFSEKPKKSAKVSEWNPLKIKWLPKGSPKK